MNTYFKSGGKLYRIVVDTDSPVIAIRQAHFTANLERLTPESPVLAVIQGGKAAVVPVEAAA